MTVSCTRLSEKCILLVAPTNASLTALQDGFQAKRWQKSILWSRLAISCTTVRMYQLNCTRRVLERWCRAAKLGIKRNDARGRGATAAEHPRVNWMKDSDSPQEIQGSDHAKSKKIYQNESRWDLVTSATHCNTTSGFWCHRSKNRSATPTECKTHLGDESFMSWVTSCEAAWVQNPTQTHQRSLWEHRLAA